jgi:hypothetical protein
MVGWVKLSLAEAPELVTLGIRAMSSGRSARLVAARSDIQATAQLAALEK